MLIISKWTWRWANVQRNQDKGNIVIFKAPLHKILQNPQHVDRYREVVRTINTIVTAAYLLIRFIFVNEYDDDDYDHSMLMNTSHQHFSRNA